MLHVYNCTIITREKEDVLETSGSETTPQTTFGFKIKFAPLLVENYFKEFVNFSKNVNSTFIYGKRF